MDTRKALLVKTLRELLTTTVCHSLPQSQQQMHALDIHEEEIRMSRNLLYVEGTSEKLRCILRSHKIRSTFCTENTLHKLLCKLKV